ncbi:unnamed protein product [Trichobilharzia szidati]|nr:unnamed protein product [Trichobilharzia szidati]
MSQVTNTTTGIINTNNGNTPWNRTPGKPGVGSGNTAGTHSAFSSAPSAVPWSTTNRGDIDLIQERDQIEDSVDKKTQSIRSLVSYANSKNSDNSSTNTNTAAAVANTTATGNTGQMWPPPVFDSPRLTDRNVGGFLSQESSSSTDNQWATTTPFSGQTASAAAAVGAAGNTNSLLGSPNSFPNIINHTQTINPNLWSFDNSNNCPSAPRAITGQQLNVTLATTSPPPSETTSSEHTRRYMNWTLGSDQDLLNDDRSGLAFPLSNININSNNNNNSIGGFGNQSDFIENQSSFSSPMNANIRNSSNKISEFDVGQSNISKKSNSDIDTSTCDTEEAIRTAVNTTEPWGIHPVDQSTPWNCSEANGDCLPTHSSASITGTPGNNDLSTSASRVTGLNQSSGGGVSNIQPSGSITTTATAATIATQSSLHSRRLSSANSSSAVVSRDLESNIWPSEPPNGTGIWESHYESLGERTARWHQSTNSGQPPTTTPLQPPPLTSQASFASHSLNPANFVSSQMSQHPSHRSRPQQGQIPSNTESFRGINRGPVVPGTIFPLGQPPPPTPNVMNLGTRSLFGGNHSLGQINSNVGGNTGPSRGFPIAAPVNLGPGVSWPYSPATHPGDPAVPGINFGNKSRWPGPNMNRLPVGGKQQQQQQQQHPPTHILPNMTSTGLRWPPGGTTPQMQGVWPLTTDQRRPGTVQGPQWSSASTSGMDNNPSGYFNQPNQSLPPRASQQISVPEFPTSLAAASSRGVNQAFRTPQSAFYPAMTPGFTSSSMSQRMFMSPQQHSQQLQQQSVIRAHVMRQLFSLGFSEDEIQPIFADTNTSVERALIDLRDRSGHPGIDELINSLKPITASLLTSLNPDDGSLSCLGQNSTPTNRLMMAMRGNDLSKSTLPMHSQPAENLELSLQLLQQRESQILQTIVQLQSKHQELNQKLSHIRSANVPFATNPVMQELQLQTFQVAQQIDAQQAQLKHVRSQAAMLKQINLPPNLLSSSSSNPSSSSSLHGGMTATTTPLLPPLSMSGMPGQSSSSSLHGMSPLPLNSTGNCNSLNLLTTSNNNNNNNNNTNSSWSLQSGSNLGGKSNHQLLNNSGNNNNNNNMTSGVTDNHPDFSQDQSNFNMMNSLLWESSPWSGSSSQQHLSENFSTTNRNHLSSDRRWPLPPGAGSGVTGNGNSSSIISSSSSANRSAFISSQLASLGDPRWTDIANDMSNSTGNDTRQQQSLVGGEIDELRNCGGGGIDYPLIPISISSKSWLLAHNIPPHVSVGMLKATVSTALSNHLMKSSEAHEKSGDSRNNNNNGEPEFEIHPNMSARWILLGLCNSLQASVVHKSLENANNSQLNGYYGSVKLITPAEALLHLQDIQSLASRLKGLSTDNCLSSASSNLHSINQSSSILTGCDFNSGNNNINNSNNLNNDISGSNYSMIGSNTANNNNNNNTSDI